MKDTESRKEYSIATVDRAVKVLASLNDSELPLTLVKVAGATGLSEATALRYLSSLAGHDLVERDERGRYRLGIGLFRLGHSALGERDPRKVALPLMERLLETFQETVNLAMRHRDDIVLIEVIESQRSIKKGATVGQLDIWHASALGKAILAHVPETEARGILERRGCPRFTDRSLTSFDALEPSFESVRELGYAMDDEEYEEGLRCVGAPIFDQRGRASYALSVSAPAGRLAPELIRDIGQEVREAAAAISAALGYLPELEKGADHEREARARRTA